MKLKHTQILGIDLGTSNIVVSYLDETGTPRILVINGKNSTRSATYVSEDMLDIIVGEEALNMSLLEPDNVFTYVKRHVGTDKVFKTIGGVKITPQFIQTEQLKYIFNEIKRFFGDGVSEFHVVITVPAGANEAFRQAVRQAALDAGFQVLEIINEPTAAALDNGLQDNQGDRNVVVFDCGGGTTDLTVGTIQGGLLVVHGSYGDNQLGGKDVNDILMQHALDAYTKQHGFAFTKDQYPNEYYQLETEIERQKGMLSSKSKVRIVASADGHTLDLTITREEFERLIKPVIDKIDTLARKAIAESDISIDDIDHVLFVGGSTRLKPVRAWAEGFFGKDKIFESKISPDLTVAQGAAIRAVQVASQTKGQVVDESLRAIPVPEISHEDVTSNPLGIAIVDPRNTRELICSSVLDRNTPIPAKASSQFNSLDKKQTLFLIQVLQGEDGANFKDCLIVGEAKLTLPARDPRSNSLEVTMSYDCSGMATVTVFDTVSNHTEDITVDFTKPQALAS